MPWLTLTALAVIVTLANAVKPVLVDDTAYLLFARQAAAHPADPYGFLVFWYYAPEPAMEVLCPPVLPYWLAAGVRLFGEDPVLLKLWLFPFVWVLAAALAALLRRFARGVERPALVLFMASPAVLMSVNLMLDVPAVALGLAALAVFARACDRRVGTAHRAASAVGGAHLTEIGSPFSGWKLAAAAGLLAALAVQTKYTMLTVPPLLVWYGLTRRRVALPAVAAVVAVAAFAGWEAYLHSRYGESHFLHHVSQQGPTADPEAGPPTLATRIAAWWEEKRELFAPLVGHLGCLAAGFGLYAGRAAGFPRWVVTAAGLFMGVGFLLVCAVPHADAVLVAGSRPGHDKLTLAALVWRTMGVGVLFTTLGCALLLLYRWRGKGFPWADVRDNADAWFVVGWVLLEVAAYVVLTPFPAARRVIGVTVAVGVLAARAVSRVSRARPDRRPPRWVVPAGVAFGVAVAALDTWDAFPEKWAAERAAVAAGNEPGADVWYVGHWGFQYYAERAGMKPAILGDTAFRPGDRLVLPLFPDKVGFHRPYPGYDWDPPPEDAADKVAEFAWEDRVSGRTVPNFYGGVDPVAGRDHPRVRVAVYRFKHAWKPERP